MRRRADGQAVGMLQAVLSNGGRSAEIAWAVGVPWQGQGIAMVLHERLAADPGWDVRVLASDLSEQMVRRTRVGRHSQLEVNRGLPAARLLRHFSRAGTEWQVNEPLRRLVEVRQLNLTAPFPPLPPIA